MKKDMIENYTKDLENIKKNTYKPKTFLEIFKIIVGALNYDYNDIMMKYPKDLYEAFGKKPQYEYLRGCKTLSECKHPKAKRLFKELKAMGIDSSLIDISVDIEKLKLMQGQRGISPKGVKEKIKSIQASGIINGANGLLNSNDEIADGQHRICALIILGQPFRLVKDIKVTVNTVRTINNNTSGWKDYTTIKSNADLGNIDFVYINDLWQRYSKDIAHQIILTAILGKSQFPKGWQNNTNYKLNISDNDYLKARQTLDYFKTKWYDYYNDIDKDGIKVHINNYSAINGVRQDKLLIPLTQLYLLDIVDMDKIMEIIHEGNKLGKDGRPTLNLCGEDNQREWLNIILSEYTYQVDRKHNNTLKGTIQDKFDERFNKNKK